MLISRFPRDARKLRGEVDDGRQYHPTSRQLRRPWRGGGLTAALRPSPLECVSKSVSLLRHLRRHFDAESLLILYVVQVVTLKMSSGGDMTPNMGTTINKIACATNGRKLNSAFHTLFK
ncbi:hypothetical protein E2C01_084681 [Portunus trituberculatus]|uniref:Uncharacterized protein n=1 Tax=Portunus trituberculatus TaxID=210409 RepID=A0A5B7J0M6_PORTR|nr:hypothetical protein [Portunus trituberculatus]